MFQFYGANRTGRFARKTCTAAEPSAESYGDLAEARALVRCGDYDSLEFLYDDIPDTLSQLIRTAFIPTVNKRS